MTTKIYSGKTEDVLKQLREDPDYQSSSVEDQIATNQNLMATVQTEYNNERDLVNQLLGQAQMANAFAQFSKTVLTSKLAFVKENKLYRAIAGKKNQDGLEFSGTWEEFCNLLGWTPEHANESIANLNSFGEEALESMSRMGIGYRELRQYRRLPENEKIALIELAKIGDKESLVEFAEEIFTKHTKEKEELKKKVDDTQADYNALQKRNTDISKEKEEMGLKLSKYELKTISMDERIGPFKEKIAETQSQIDELFNDHRQNIELINKLQFEAMDNDPNYDPEAPFELPESLQTALLALHGALLLTLAQAKQMHQELWTTFGDEIENASEQFDRAINETRNATV